MAKDVVKKLKTMDDYKLPAALLVYSVFIVVSPHLALLVGGALLWVLLLYKWLWGGECG